MTDPFTTAARAEAEALVDDIIRWDDTVATDGPCDGTWDSLAAYLAGRGWARAHLAAQEPTDAELDYWMTRAYEAEKRVITAIAVLNEDTRWQDEEHLLARVREALDGDA